MKSCYINWGYGWVRFTRTHQLILVSIYLLCQQLDTIEIEMSWFVLEKQRHTNSSQFSTSISDMKLFKHAFEFRFHKAKASQITFNEKLQRWFDRFDSKIGMWKNVLACAPICPTIIITILSIESCTYLESFFVIFLFRNCNVQLNWVDELEFKFTQAGPISPQYCDLFALFSLNPLHRSNFARSQWNCSNFIHLEIISSLFLTAVRSLHTQKIDFDGYKSLLKLPLLLLLLIRRRLSSPSSFYWNHIVIHTLNGIFYVR